MSASSSDSGGKEKPPDHYKKKKKGKKPITNSSEPTEKALVGPSEKANSTGAVTATEDVLAVTSEQPAKTSAMAVSGPIVSDATASANATSKACVPATTKTAVASTMAQAMEADTARRIEPTKSLELSVTTNTPNTAGSAPKLSEVVRAASSSAPEPVPIKMRPPLSSASKKINKESTSTITKTPTADRVVVGTTYAQQVSGSSNRSSFIEISGKYVTPRPPPSDSGKPRPKSDAGLQGLFEGRWQDDRYGMYFEHIRGSAQSAYLKAIAAVIPRENIFSFGLVGRGMAELYTTDLESATKLMLEGIEVGGRHLTPYPVTVKPSRVVFSRVPMRADHEDLLTFLRKFGKVHGKVRAIPLKTGDEGLGRGIFSTSREAFISLNQGCVLPSGFYLNISGSRSWIDVTTEAKCHACHQVGHFVADCPKRARKAAETASKETPAVAATSKEATLPNAAPTLDEQSARNVPEVTSQEAVKPAEIGVTSTRENATSTDEEQQNKTSGKKKLTKRKSKSKIDQVAMPPPRPVVEKNPSPAPKRRHSEEESGSRSSKVIAVESIDDTDRLSDCEMQGVDETGSINLSGYESCGSSLSFGSHFEITKDLRGLPREKIRSLLDSLHYKKNPETIWSILKRDLVNPDQILPQLRLLQKEAKRGKRYNEAARCERLYNKIQSIIQDRILADPLRQ